jgi:S1-C subfamily serine protease
VDRTGPHNDGEGPEDSDRGAEDPEDNDTPVRGWVPPEERLWRHPSELLSPSPAAAGAEGLRPPARRREAWVSALVGAGAATAVVIAGLLMASPRPAGLTSALERSSPQPRSVGRSLVVLLTTGSGGTTVDCAVAVASGGLVATTADALIGASAVAAWRDGRWVPATIVGTDADSDVGLVRVPFDLPVARFADEAAVTPGTRVWTMDVASASFSAGDVGGEWSSAPGTVRAAGTAVNGARGQGMPGIVVAPTLTADTTGGILVGARGTVLGVEDTSVESPVAGAVFLPADLVVGVSEDLAADGTVTHGWLGINGGNATSGGAAPSPLGAVVEAVDPTGPAAAALRPGDVILAIDGTPVRSMADLRSRLYTLAAGSTVWLRIDRRGTRSTVEVDLGSSP